MPSPSSLNLEIQSISQQLVGDVLNAAHRAFGGEWPPVAKGYVRNHARRYKRALLKLAGANAREWNGQVRKRSFMVEHSFSGRFCAFLLGYPKGGKALTLEQAIKLTEQVNLRKASSEKVRVRELEKPDGGTRVIMTYGPKDRAAQRLADDILRAIWGFSSLEYSRRGRGRDAAIRDIVNSHNEGGARRYIKMDIAKFFPSIGVEKMESLIPLPNSVIRNTLRIPINKTIDLSLAPSTSENTVRMGLPAGSRPSAVIASRVLEIMLQGLPGARLVLSHGDDAIVAVRSNKQAESVKNTLALRAAEHPCGPFLLKELTVLQLGQSHDFLGYMIRHRLKAYGGGARVSASHKAILRFQRKLARSLALLPNDTWFEIAERKIEQWSRSFGQWKHDGSIVDRGLADFQGEVDPVLSAFEQHLKGNCFASPSDKLAQFDLHFLPSVGKQWASLKQLS